MVRAPTRRWTALIWWTTSIMGLLSLLPVEAALALAPGQFGRQRLQVRCPEAPEVIEPRVDLTQRLGVHRVQAPGPARPHGRQAAVPEHPQVLRDGRLGDAELPLDDRADRAGGQLPLGEQLQDPPPHRIAEHVKRMHLSKISRLTYISQILYNERGQA